MDITKKIGVEQILKYGDALEITAFSTDDFATRVNYYAEVWGDFVLPNREKDKINVTEQWSEFAEHNYTSLIRCWHVSKAINNIDICCTRFLETKDYGILLELHGEIFSFFCNAGSAVENIFKACEVEYINYPITLELNDKEIIGSLGWFYNRRTQYVHKILIPIFKCDDLIYYDDSIYIDETVNWTTVSYSNPSEISSSLNKLWDQFCVNMNKLWAKLYSHLKGKYKGDISKVTFDATAFGIGGGVSGQPAPKGYKGGYSKL